MYDSPSTVTERRQCTDRRTRWVRALLCSFYMGRRHSPQRNNELCRPYYTDVYGPGLLVVILLIVSFCAADAGLTILILQKGGVELNPLMVWLLESSSRTFFTAKFFLTSACLMIVLMHVNYRLFNKLTMHHILVSILGLYVVLISYELRLLAA